jgi:competence ComEA-like helix-hairpin-helix protein
LVYGVSDESSRLNINHASIESLAKLPGMDASLAARIVDYRDDDSQVSPDGAEEESYITLNPPRLPLNAPFTDTWEVLGVAGMTREIFMGEDFNLNSMLDPDEDNGELTSPVDNNDGILNGGISTLVTHATVSSLVDARGEARVNVQSASESELQLLDGISQDIAKAIVAYREQNEFSSVADLLEVREMQSDGNNNNNSSNRNRRGGSGNRGGQSGNNNRGGSSSPTGSPLISKEMLIQIADKIMVGTETTAPGAVNLNTAPREVLVCLPGLEENGADAIIRYRQSNGNFKNTAEILNIPEITTQIFKQLAPVTCARSETYRIFSEGKFGTSGAIKRIQVIVRIGESTVETLSYKEDL